MVYPRWSPTGYGSGDVAWHSGVQEIQQQTAACWLEMPLLFEQPSASKALIAPGGGTPSLASFIAGVRYAHAHGFHVFVTPLVHVGGSQPWVGSLAFSTVEQDQAWFQAYWNALEPYVVAAQQNGVEQFAIGTEEASLESEAPTILWDSLIVEFRQVFKGTLTYDRNWGSLGDPTPAWMHNTDLAMIGVSAYFPLENIPARLDPQVLPTLWHQTVIAQLDAFARSVGKPLFVSETGYRATSDALYHTWDVSSTAPPDPQEQAAACGAALSNVLADPHLHGIFFWGWRDVEQMSLAGSVAAHTIHAYYAPFH